jgi:hypothetical protein
LAEFIWAASRLLFLLTSVLKTTPGNDAGDPPRAVVPIFGEFLKRDPDFSESLRALRSEVHPSLLEPIWTPIFETPHFAEMPHLVFRLENP